MHRSDVVTPAAAAPLVSVHAERAAAGFADGGRYARARPDYPDDAVGVISQHLNTPPVDPSWQEPTGPEPLGAAHPPPAGDPCQRWVG